MTLKELKQTQWYLERPNLIKQTINKLPPIYLYKLKESGKQCQIISFEEPESGKLEEVTCTVQKTGIGGAMSEMGLGTLDDNEIFGVELNSLEIWTE